MTEATSDHGTVLPAGSHAIMVDKDGKWTLLIPEVKGKDVQMPYVALLLTAMFIKGERDKEWGDDLIDEVRGRRWQDSQLFSGQHA